MVLEKTKRKVKCKVCGESKICNKYKTTNICNECLDRYLELKVTCVVCKVKISRKNEYIYDTPKLTFCSKKCYYEHFKDLEYKSQMDEYLKGYYKTKNLPVRIYQQMEYFKKEKGVSYYWTYLTIRYITRVECKDLDAGNIGLVLWYVDKCKEYTKHIEKLKLAKSKPKSDKTEEVKVICSTKNSAREKMINKCIIKEEDLKGVELW